MENAGRKPIMPWEPRYRTMVFENEAEYVRFTDYIYDVFDGRGVELTNVPIVASLRVTQWLLNELELRGEQFAMHEVNEEDKRKAREAAKGRRFLDPASLDDFHVPGIPRKL